MGAFAIDDIRAIVADPREGLDVELKGWVDPLSSEGRATIAKACLALRNNDGGLLLLGFNNDGSANTTNVPADARAAYHVDLVQEIVSKYASEPFGVSIEFIARGTVEHPVIVVPSGVRTPVACKSDLPGDGSLLKCDCVYVRTLRANNIISSSLATYRDWSRIAEICFDNREANIGAFVRRHLAGPKLSEAIAAISHLDLVNLGKPAEIAFLDQGNQRFEAALARTEHSSLVDYGTLQMAVCAEGSGEKVPMTQEMLWRISASVPQISGWPPWVVLLNASDESYHPYIMDGGWQALVVGGVLGPHVDFWRIEPEGKLFHLRITEDDLTASPNRPERGTSLDYHLQVIRVAEFLTVAIHIVRALGLELDSTTLGVACRWTKLEGRRLCSWINPRYAPLRHQGVARQDEITTTTRVPLAAPDSALGQHVSALVSPMFALFGGFSMEVRGFDQMIMDFYQRRF